MKVFLSQGILTKLVRATTHPVDEGLGLNPQ